MQNGGRGTKLSQKSHTREIPKKKLLELPGNVGEGDSTAKSSGVVKSKLEGPKDDLGSRFSSENARRGEVHRKSDENLKSRVGNLKKFWEGPASNDVSNLQVCASNGRGTVPPRNCGGQPQSLW